MPTSIPDDLERIALQEQQLQFSSFDEEAAWKIGSRLRVMGVTRGLKIVIDVRRVGQPLFYTALSRTTPDNVEWVRRKVNVVERFHRSSYAIGLEMQQKNTSLTESQGLRIGDYAAHGGCFPLRVRDAGLIGTITVSGLPQRADHELVIEALCEELDRDYNAFKLP